MSTSNLICSSDRGPPNNDCKEEIELILSKNAKKIAVILFTVGFFAMIGFAVSLILSYAKPKNNFFAKNGF